MRQKGEKILADSGAEALFTSCGYLQRYLTDFLTEDGFTLVDGSGTTLYTDSRYLEAAQKALKSSGVKVEKISKDNPPEKILSKYQRVAIPFDETSYREYERLQTSGARLTDATAAFQRAMSIKSEDELQKIRRACEIAEEAFLRLLPTIREGQREKEIAAVLEYEMRKAGADGTSFDTIVAFGEHAAVPHHKTGDRLLKKGEEILIDFGCQVDGYCSDITRTLLFGDDGKHEAFKRAYAAVLRAHERVLEEARSGMTAGQVDGLAREVLEKEGYGEYFTHSLGHGIGLRIHEYPTVAKGRETVLQDGMVFSNEPGVYVVGEYGIRIEDTTVLQEGRLRSLMSKTKKSLVIL